MHDTATAALPSHVGFIVDGNRRWATAQGIPKLQGHKRGMENLRARVSQARKLGIQYVSAFIFSTENWQRSAEEVAYLMDLFVWYADKELKQLSEENIKIVFLGTRDRLPAKVLAAMDRAEARTKQFDGMTLALCLNYGGQQELADAMSQLVSDGVVARDITAAKLAQYLYHPEIPPVDLIIRTSGEQRLSNFMLWRAAYAELYFTTKAWPDFAEADLLVALADYANRHRRHGK